MNPEGPKYPILAAFGLVQGTSSTDSSNPLNMRYWDPLNHRATGCRTATCAPAAMDRGSSLVVGSRLQLVQPGPQGGGLQQTSEEVHLAKLSGVD